MADRSVGSLFSCQSGCNRWSCTFFNTLQNLISTSRITISWFYEEELILNLRCPAWEWPQPQETINTGAENWQKFKICQQLFYAWDTRAIWHPRQNLPKPFWWNLSNHWLKSANNWYVILKCPWFRESLTGKCEQPLHQPRHRPTWRSIQTSRWGLNSPLMLPWINSIVISVSKNPS